MNFKKYKLLAIFFTTILLGSMIIIPSTGAYNIKNINGIMGKIFNNIDSSNPNLGISSFNDDEKALLDTYYLRADDLSLQSGQNDIGYNTDAGDIIPRSLPIYIGEPIDQTVPGRGRQGTLDPSDGDEEDWFAFTVSEGQNIQASLITSNDFSLELADTKGNIVGQSFLADITGRYFAHIYTNPGATNGDYTLTISLSGQNDAGEGTDAGDDINTATTINPGEYSGYMSFTDQEDWYSFNVNSGQGIFITVEPVEKKEGDFDIHLYNPSGQLVHYEMYYGGDSLEYPADVSGIWKFKISMWPGWDTSIWPDNYFLYGSGAYEMSLSVGGSAQPPLPPIPQTEVIPVAQTFEITNNPDSNEDEYSFLAAVPAAVYKEDGNQYVSPVVYTGDNTITSWFGEADDTTQYLIDDWDEYLSHHGFASNVFKVDNYPIKAAADIALNKWKSSDTAVLAVDGSSFKDVTGILDIDRDATLNVKTDKLNVQPGDQRFIDFAGYPSIQMWCGKEWGSMTIYAYGADCPEVGLMSMRYELSTYEDWPHPYDTPGDNTNIYFPLGLPGFYWPFTDGSTGFDTFEVTRYSCDRYTLNVKDSDSSIYVSVTTSDPSYLEVFLVDPEGVVRRPIVPSWNGGPINPLHIWNGDHHNGFEEWRRWEPTYSTEHSINLHYPSEGKWTIIVTPHYKYGEEKTSDTIPYHITAEIREHNPQRINAALSAANAAVLASQIHAPLLYVTENSVPTETQNVLNQLDVNNILFVNINDISSATPIGSVTKINTMQKVIDAVKSYTGEIQPSVATSDNVITITSFGTEDGFFAPAGLIAAYHGSNVLNIGEVPNVFNLNDKATAYREYSGGWYHGNRAQGHTSKMSEPIPNLIELIKTFLSGDFPPLGLDNDLGWWGTIHDELYNWVTDKGLTGPGQEVYLFVSPRDTEIRHPIITQMCGLGSYAGQFPFDTPGLDAALISRDILYPAIIFANPGRDVTTSQLMNFPDGWTWTTNDKVRHTVYSTREFKQTFSSHGRFFEGHTIFDAWLNRINEGASVSYYSGHGTGGSGISAQYANVAEAFPDAELTHENLHDFDWWDSWRGYMYDDTQTKTPRWGGFTWYNAAEPNLYDIIHYKWVDQLLNNTHSEIEIWMSCTTGQHFGPEIYLEHGSALWFGNAGTGLCPQEDLLDDWWMKDMMTTGSSIGQAFSKYVWYHQRDFTAKFVDDSKYQMSLYGTSTEDVTNVQVIFGDPTLTVYSPEWIEPIPVQP